MTWGQRGIASGFTYVLAAILGPHEFGLVALGLAFVELVQVVVQQGSSTAPVQRERLEQEHLDAAFGRASGGASCSRSRPRRERLVGPGERRPSSRA